MRQVSVFGQSNLGEFVKLTRWFRSRIHARFAPFRNGAIYESHEKDDRPT
jgi:hypothetical protein